LLLDLVLRIMRDVRRSCVLVWSVRKAVLKARVRCAWTYP